MRAGEAFEGAVQQGIGRTVQAATMLDSRLLELFCALVGSKYAVIVAAGQLSGWLLDQCKALVSFHRELAPKHKDRLTELLQEAGEAIGRRNRIVHDMWSYGSDGVITLVSRKRKTYELDAKPLSLDEVEKNIDTLGRLGYEFMRATEEAFGAIASAEGQLRWEDYLNSLPQEALAELIERRIVSMSARPPMFGASDPDASGS